MRAVPRRRLSVAAALVVFAGCLPATIHAAGPPAGKDELASAIEKRLNAIGDSTTAMTASAGYFYRNPILPSRAFQTAAGCEQRYTFSVFVYKTKAQAVAMYDYFYQHVLDMGGDFHAFNMVRHGRVIYTGYTGSPNTNAPTLPTRQFRALAAEVNAPLPSHPRGCVPGL